MAQQMCRKQVVTCEILAPCGTTVTATNMCDLDPTALECPRVTAGCSSGEGYELCGPPVHAEEAALAKALKRGVDVDGGTAFIMGHSYVCQECQETLVAAGVRTFVICGD